MHLFLHERYAPERPQCHVTASTLFGGFGIQVRFDIALEIFFAP
jgi:hypothetical protein